MKAIFFMFLLCCICCLSCSDEQNTLAEEQNVIYHGANGTELFSEESVQDGDTVTVLPWNLKIVEEA